MKFTHTLAMVLLLVVAAVFTYWVLVQIITTIGGLTTLLVVAGIVAVAGVIYASQKADV